MRPLMMVTVGLVAVLVAGLVAVAHAAEQDTCSGSDCHEPNEGAADKYSREKNQPHGGSEVRSKIAVLQGALLSLMKDPYNPDVLRSSLVELAEFADTPEGEKFMESFTDMMSGGQTSGPAGAMVKQLFTAVMSGNVDLGSLMKNGINAGSLASLASGLLKKDNSGTNMKPEDIMPLLKNFLQVIKEEQGSPFLIKKLTEAFQETMSLEQLKKFEKSAASILGNIRGATEDDDSNFIYDQSALDTFSTYLHDFVDMHDWDWAKNEAKFMREIKRVMRMFPGSEDQIGTLLPALLEAIADASPSKSHLQEIIDNFGGVLGIVVKKNNASPDIVHQVIDKLRTPLKQTAEYPPTATPVKSTDTDDSKNSDLPDISRLIESVSKLVNDPSELQEAIAKVMAKGKDIKMDELADMLPKMDGLDEVTAYFNRVQNTEDEREIANHFHRLMDMIGDSFEVLADKDVRHTAIEQALPYVRVAHDFLKEPMALFKIQMGIASLSSMYQVNIDDLVKKAAPHVEDTLSVIGIDFDLPKFVDDSRRFLLKAYHQIYQSPDSAFKKLSSKEADTFMVESIDHSVTEPIVHVLGAYRLVRSHPDCLLQTLCTINRQARISDRGQLGVRPAVTKVFSRVFGLLLATSQHGIDSPIHEQIGEAVVTETDTDCQEKYPGCSLAKQ